MRKPSKILSMFLVVCMLVMLLPMGVLAENNLEPKGDPDGAYSLNVVNDSDALMLFEVTLNGQKERIPVGAGETLTYGINEGDQFKVTKVGNTNYTVDSESATFVSGDYENTIGKDFTHKVGAGFKVGEKHTLYLNNGEVYEGTAKTLNGKTVAAETAIDSAVSVTQSSSNGKASFSVRGETKTATVSGNYTVSGSGAINSASVANTRAANLQTAVNNLFTSTIQALPDYDAGTWEMKNSAITASYSNGLLGIGRRVSFSATNVMAYQPVEDVVEDVVDEVAPGDITLTYTTEVKAKTGNVEVNVLNAERLDQIHEKVDTDLLVGMMSMLTAGQGSEGTGMSMDTFTDLFANEDLMGLLAIEASDNMPKGFVVTLKEKDKGDGLYEGLEYTIPMTETMFIHLDMDEMMKEALGSTLYALAKGQIPAEMLAMKVDLPVSIGQSFALEGVRMGNYTMTITSPGEGWYSDTETFDISVTNGGTVNNVGGNHIYGNVRTSTLIGPLTQAMGMNAGCLGSMAGLLLGNNSLKMVQTYGVPFNHKLNHIEFTNAKLEVDDAGKVTTTGIPGATFMLVDRDRFNALIDSFLGMGEAVINSVVGGIRFDELLGLKEEINEGDSEDIETEPGMMDRILVSILALGDRLDGIQVPAMLESVADDNGLVTFDPENNVTLQKLIDLIPKLMDAAEGIGNIAGQIGSIVPGSGDSGEPVPSGDGGEDPAQPSGSSGGSSLVPNLGSMDMGAILQLLNAIGDPEQLDALNALLSSLGGMGSGGDSGEEPAEPSEPSEPSDPSEPADPEEPGEEAPNPMEIMMNMLQEFGGGDIGFALVNLLGLSEGRFPTGNYILIQTAVPEGRIRNPMMYVFENTWNAEEREYHTYASIDLAGVMSNEQFATFAGQLEQSYVVLEEVFGQIAASADNGLNLARDFFGEGDSYNSRALLDRFDEIASMILAQIEAARAAAEEPAEEPAEPGEDEPDVPAEPGETEEPVQPLDPEDPAASVSDSLKDGLASILDQVLNTYIPKATVLSYFSNLIYRNAGSLFDSQQDVSDLLMSFMDENLTFTQFNERIHSIMDDANFVLNGEVTKNWYYYDVNPNIFTNINVAYHYILNEMLPPELANVIERALQGSIDMGEDLVDELINQIASGDTEEAPVPPEPDAPDLPGTPDNGGTITDVVHAIGGLAKFIGDLVNFFKRL